jgi:hypothetical protein
VARCFALDGCVDVEFRFDSVGQRALLLLLLFWLERL